MYAERAGPLVSLLSDLGTRDGYVGVMKGVILSLCPRARIVDLCHHIPPQDIQQAAFVLDTAWGYFPEGTVHMVVVDPGVGSARRVVAVEAQRQQFLAPDNGVLTYVLDSARSYRAFSVEETDLFLPEVSQTFHGRDILAPVAARLAGGMPIEDVGPELAGPLTSFQVSHPVETAAGLIAHVIHVDRFGNLVTDLTEGELWAWQQQAGAEDFLIRVADSAIEEIRTAYAGVAASELLALFGSAGRLEIALNLGNAAELLGIGRGAVIVVEPRG
jgi:hypothetical protein